MWKCLSPYIVAGGESQRPHMPSLLVIATSAGWIKVLTQSTVGRGFLRCSLGIAQQHHRMACSWARVFPLFASKQSRRELQPVQASTTI